MRRCFVDNIDDTKKFWIIDWEDKILYTIYGDAGKMATHRSSKFDTEQECLESVEKKVQGRFKKKEIEVDDYTNYFCQVGVKNYHTKQLYHSNFTKHFTNDIYYTKNMPFAPFDKSIGVDVLDYAQINVYKCFFSCMTKGASYDFNDLPKYLLEDIWKYDMYINPLNKDDFDGADMETAYVSLITTYCSAFSQIKISGKLDKSLKEKALASMLMLPYYADKDTLKETLEKVIKPMYDDLSTFLAEGETKEDIKSIKEFSISEIQSSMMSPFEMNMKFLNKETYENTFFETLFTEANDIKIVNMGKADFPTGEVVISDPIAYLGTEHQMILNKTIPTGSYATILSIGNFSSVGTRVICAKLVISDKKPIKFELAKEKNNATTEEKSKILSVIGIDTGLCSFADVQTAKANFDFRCNWSKENKDKNIYEHYFSEKFSDYSKKYSNIDGNRENFLEWVVENTQHTVTMFSSGMGDGIYSAYFGFDENNEICQIVIPFMNPDFFR